MRKARPKLTPVLIFPRGAQNPGLSPIESHYACLVRSDHNVDS